MLWGRTQRTKLVSTSAIICGGGPRSRSMCARSRPKSPPSASTGNPTTATGWTARPRFLADLLQKEIDSGRTERYARLRQSQIEQAPNEPCSLCEGTGTHKPAPERGAGDPTKDGIVCNSCDGNGYVRPWVDNYSFSVENVQEFANFLRNCSGFEIW